MHDRVLWCFLRRERRFLGRHGREQAAEMQQIRVKSTLLDRREMSVMAALCMCGFVCK